jgi:uncharacterized protein (TIGR02448 family)
MTHRNSILAVLVLCVAAAPAALASSFAGTSAGSSAGASSAGSSASSNSTSGDDKLVREAREDAAGFVASDGQVRSARLEAALRVMRERDPAAREAGDLALARKILAAE